MTHELVRLMAALADRYRIERELGAGGMATVYLAEDLKHRRQVAVKVLRSDLAQTLGAERFVREIEIAAQLHHPHILPLLDSGEADDFLFYVMPYVEGESLRTKLDREHELPVPEAIKILHEVVDGLAKAHSRGVIHRDIKPDNVLLSDGHAAVADFGVAKALSEATGSAKITTAGIALGTPAYMAPEQVVADPNVDHRADIYAVGVMAYEMLAGRPPFDGATPQAVLSAQVTEIPDPVSTHRDAVPPPLSALVMKCLEKKAADRWQSAEDLREELEKLKGSSGGTSSISGVQRTRAPSRLIAVAAIVVLAVGGGFWVNRGESSTVVGSAERMAVIPFAPTVNDSSLFRLGRDMVVLLSRNLDGVGDVVMVDASTVLTRIREEDRGLSLDEAAEAARELDARSFVHGRLVRAGTDVILDVTLNESTDGNELARASVRAREDDIVALTDSVTWALLASVWRGADAPTPSLGAVTTRSLGALRAFLDGERAIARNEWLEADDFFRVAFEADSTFLLAYFRFWQARSWFALPTDSAIINRVRRDRHLLPERERLLVDARFEANLEARLAIGRELTDRFPDYWPGWLELGDRMIHTAPYLGYDVADARPAFERLVTLNPGFRPGWDHLSWIAINTWDEAAAIRALERLDSLPGGTAVDQEWTRFQRDKLRARRGDLTLSDVEIDRLARAGIQVARDLENPMVIVSSAPDFETLIQVTERALELTSRPEENRAARISQARATAATGAWRHALELADRFNNRDSTPDIQMLRYRLVGLSRWLDALPPGGETDRRPTTLIAAPETDTRLRAEVLWWDGAIGFANRDQAAISQARRDLMEVNDQQRAYLDSSLAAYQMALSGRELDAARVIAGLELNAENATWTRGSWYTAVVNRLAAAVWFTNNGAPAEGDRLLRYTEAAITGPERIGAMMQVLGVSVLQRARAAEASGRNDAAADFYNRFLLTYTNPDSSHQHLRDEAVTALANLTSERN